MSARLGRFNAWLLVIAVAGVGIRLVYVYVLTPGTHVSGDAYFYHWQANLLAEGRGFIDPYRWLVLGRTTPTAAHPPLWPLLLSAVSKIGWTGAHAHRATSCLVGGGTIVVLGLLGRRVGGERVALTAAVLAALYPTLIGVNGWLMSESLFGLLVALIMLAGYRFYDRPASGSALLLGAAIGFAALTRSEALLFLPLIALPIAWKRARPRLPPSRSDRGPRPFALACAATAVVIAPWMIRTWSTFDRPVLISTNGPAVLKGANCAKTYRGRDIGSWRHDCITGPRSANEAKNGVRWAKEALGYERDHVGDLPRVMTVRLLRTWDFFPRRQVRQHPQAARVGLVGYYVLLALSLYGIVLLYRRREPLVILVAPAIVVSFVSIFYFGLPRFRAPAEISLVVLTAVAVTALAERVACGDVRLRRP